MILAIAENSDSGDGLVDSEDRARRSRQSTPLLHLPLTSLSLDIYDTPCTLLLQALSTSVSHLTTLELKLQSDSLALDALEAFFAAAAPSLLHLSLDLKSDIREVVRVISRLLPSCTSLYKLSTTAVNDVAPALPPSLEVFSLTSDNMLSVMGFTAFMMVWLEENPQLAPKLREVRLPSAAWRWLSLVGKEEGEAMADLEVARRGIAIVLY